MSKRASSSKPFGSEPQFEKVVSATLFQFSLDFPAGSTTFVKVDDVQAVIPATFGTMARPIIPGTGLNTIQALGIYQGQSGRRATLNDPFQRNFWICKIDHTGFNSVTPCRFDEGRNEYTYCKMSGVVAEIFLPDAPIARALPTMVTRPTNISYAQLLGAQTAIFGPGVDQQNWAWNEQHPSGMWQYITIPAGHGCSVKLGEYGTYEGWQKLLNLGFRPKTCTKNKYRISVPARGNDGVEMGLARRKLAYLALHGIIPDSLAPVYAGDYSVNNGNQMKNHESQETDWCCQFNTGVPGDTYVGGQQVLQDIQNQGFDVSAYGSAIVFMFVQYAPPTNDDGDPHDTASCQIVPIQMTIHSKCSFTKKRNCLVDAYQLASLPVVPNAS